MKVQGVALLPAWIGRIIQAISLVVRSGSFRTSSATTANLQPDELADYVRRRGFVPLGKVGEMVHE
ncbi:MAG: hypothetical protein HY670_11470 [Chloroflexi bacterium]|nr:hypothetical protein [Chloroflexota bacterium]